MARSSNSLPAAVCAVLAVLAVILAAAQTRVSGPTQVQRMVQLGGAAAWHHAPIVYGSLAAGQCAEAQIPAPGASPGMVVAPGWPDDLPSGTIGLMYAASDAVVVRLCALQSSTIQPATFSAALITWR